MDVIKCKKGLYQNRVDTWVNPYIMYISFDTYMYVGANPRVCPLLRQPLFYTELT